MMMVATGDEAAPGTMGLAELSSSGKLDPSMTLPSVWKQKSTDSMNKAAQQRKNLSEHRAAYFKFNEEVRRSQYSMQVQVNDALKKKKNTLELLIDKLNSTITAAQPVRDLLSNEKKKLEKELAEKKSYLEWNIKRVELRNQRAQTEWVADEPQRQLLAQETLLRDSYAQQEKNYKEIAESSSSLEASFKELEDDMADKKLAWELNNQAEGECSQPSLKLPSINCKRMDLNAAANVKLDKDVEVRVDKVEHPVLLSPNIWHGSTMKNIDKNKRIQTRSMGLCDGCDTISRKLAEAILQAHHWVAQALEERLKEQKKMIEELEEQLRLTMEEIEEAETTVAMLKQALEDLAEPLRVSEKRLDIHSKRPQRELIEDDVYIHLKSELDELRYQEALLVQRKIKVEQMLSDLIGTRDEIRDDIQLKQFCVDLDTKCLEMGSYPDKQ